MTRNLLIAIPLLPLLAAVIAGLTGRRIGRAASAGVTILAVGISCALSLEVVRQLYFAGAPAQDLTLYTWLVTDGIRFQVGFLVDRLSALMMAVVTFVSFCVHVYTIGYMREDAGFQRFFSYIALFTFAMLMLVMSNNFMQLFFGWEAVGLVSYLLIGFWYTRPTAIYANMKAFLVNRVGDFGFALGIGLVLAYFGTMDYATAFKAAPGLAGKTIQLFPGMDWSLMSVTCICLFIGAMGKSAQFPLHVWLPDSMEGPTPISALIHAATMVTAGIFMVARMSPLFEFSEAALSFVLVIGATTALFMGFLGVVNNDIKRVIAYSTLSQLGYMTVALGISAYSAAIFHLMTHAFFKALLFLGAGSVIIGMHHEQDMRKMGGLAKYMPITAATCWIGALALIGTPFFSGFYSKDALIEAVGESHRWGAVYAYWCVQAGAFVTALYTFRLVFMTFHGKERFHGHDQGGVPHESPWVVTVPLIALAIPSVIIGYLTVGPLLFGGAFGGSIFVNEANDVVGELGRGYHGPLGFALHGLKGLTFWLALAGVWTAWYLYLKNTAIPERIAQRFGVIYNVLVNKYYFDWFNERVIAPFARLIGRLFWKGGDGLLIDGVLVDGTARLVDWTAGKGRRMQTGYLYTYAFWVVIGLAALLGWFLVRA